MLCFPKGIKYRTFSGPQPTPREGFTCYYIIHTLTLRKWYVQKASGYGTIQGRGVKDFLQEGEIKEKRIGKEGAINITCELCQWMALSHIASQSGVYMLKIWALNGSYNMELWNEICHIKIKTGFPSFGGCEPLLLTKYRFAEICISLKFAFTEQNSLRNSDKYQMETWWKFNKPLQYSQSRGTILQS